LICFFSNFIFILAVIIQAFPCFTHCHPFFLYLFFCMKNPFSYLASKFGKSSTSSVPLSVYATPDKDDNDFALLDTRVNKIIDSSRSGAEAVGWFFLDQLHGNISKTFLKEYLLYLMRTGRLVAGDGSVLNGNALLPDTGNLQTHLEAVCSSLATLDYKYVRLRKC
jgi:hypothetical protein